MHIKSKAQFSAISADVRGCPELPGQNLYCDNIQGWFMGSTRGDVERKNSNYQLREKQAGLLIN